jgi:phage shock protein A
MAGQAADQVSALCDEIRSVLEQSAEDADHSLQELEDTLTEGYARALALEAERWRLERRIAELGVDVGWGRTGSSEELAAVAARLSQTGGRLDGLRALLAALRQRADVVRARGGYVTSENAGL